MLHCKVMPNWLGYWIAVKFAYFKGKIKWNFKRLILQKCLM
jgi:hypothetical protein